MMGNRKHHHLAARPDTVYWDYLDAALPVLTQVRRLGHG